MAGDATDARTESTVDSRLRALSPERRALLAQSLAARQVREPGGIPRADRSGGRLPCSPAQERLWFLDRADPGSAAYVMPAAVRFTGDLDVPVLGRCLDEIVRRHEVLRTNLVERDGVPYQVVRPPAPVPLPVRDIRDVPDVARAVDEAYLREAGTPFDLATDPMMRSSLLRTGDREHVLLVSVHHVACDGWSIGVIRTELVALYEAFRRGEPSPLPPLPIQYGDFAVWHRRRLDDGELDAQREHWRAHLAGATALVLPADRSRSSVRTSRGDAVPFRLSADALAAVDRMAVEEDATRFMVLLAAFGVVLWRWSGQRELVVGSPVAGRATPQTEPLVGFFVNTLPLRLDPGDDPAFRELVRRARRECTTAYANQDVPFERMVGDVGAARSTGAVPLVQVMLALRNVPPSRLELGGLVVEALPERTVTPKFDVALDLVPNADGGLDGRLEFTTDLFARDTAERMAEAFARVLDRGAARPDDAVSLLPLVGERENARLIAELSGEGSDEPFCGPLTLYGLFERSVDRTPDAVAVVFGDRTLTYRELDERANRLAHLLRAEGVGAEQLVGISLPRSELMVVATLGILKAGAGYVPLDPNYPRSRVAYMARDAGVAVVLTHSSVTTSDGFDEAIRFVALDAADERLAEFPATRPGVDVHPAGLAYVIYTSGSTGLPKGSANEHARVVNTMYGVNGVYGMTPADRMLAISSLNYDMSVYEVFGTLAAGAAIVVPDDIETTDPEQLLALLVEQQVTAWSSAPALLDALVAHTYQRGGMPGVRLRVVGLGGDRMPPALPGRLAEMVPGVRLLNLAGMTEASYCSLAYRVTHRSYPAGVPWGRPYANHRVYVLDRHGRPAPVGLPGELFIGGHGPGRGYWKRPRLTAERFLPDPFSPEPGGRVYATGDHARFLADGDVEFLGRLDQQIKIRGFRIEPGEIEAELATHPAVNEPVVVAFDDHLGERRLAAYVTPRGDRAPTVAELRAYLTALLPDHMVPSVFVVLDRLPLLPSGKLDRAALPAPALGRPEQEYHAPADPLEVLLARTWADVLGVEQVGASDRFFDLGGHSLMATRAVSRIRDVLQVNLEIPGFLGAGTVRALAAHLREVGGESGVDVDAVAELVAQVAAMSPEEVSAHLDG
ncbi:amino acid adenylation domain-containing protein [Saccharothrix longispora]|uniref:Amino acid adenylation domain-containing protein n=1 Tax=Saccharothrix longispora TaxID=33920 RepID=A0ABU1PTK8_9PSEU|nr:amino acid adenylation domain-containing protein [Saccharothrix longispora]MDR6593993.1 amino acid adenylation domain-containing protein [Saccharothrix longispora]